MFKVKNKEKGIGLVLEGGGSRGAYQIGAVKALYEYGVEFTSVVGTSIGAINGAYLAQGSFDTIYNMWNTMSFKDLFDVDEKVLKRLMKVDLDFNVIKYLSKKLNESLKIGGLDTTKMRNIMASSLDEDKIRNSNISYGLVTMCLSDMTPQELFIEDIKEDKLIDYIMATSNLPVFKRAVVDEKRYLDGGIWDNCPVQMLEKKGYSDAIIIRAYKRNRIRGYHGILKRNSITMHMIEPVESLGSILNFDSENLNYLLKLGYYDGLKFVNNLEGRKYYIKKTASNEITDKLNSINSKEIKEIASELNIKLTVGKMILDELKEKILPSLLLKTKIKKSISTKEAIILLLEHVAEIENIDRFNVYEFDEFVNIIKEKIKKSKNINKNNEALYKFIEAI